MKSINFLLCFSLLLCNNILHMHGKAAASKKSFCPIPSICKELILDKATTIAKLTIIPTIIISTIVYNQNNLKKNIQNNPLIACIGTILLINFIFDSFVTYKKINRILILFKHCKIIERYLLYAVAIKNTMLQFKTRHAECCFSEEEYFNSITQHTPLSFSELEKLTFEMLHNTIQAMNTLHIKAENDIETDMYILTKEHMTLEDIIEFYQNDTEFYPYLKTFLQNPIKYYDTITKKLNFFIKKQINQLILQYQ